MQIGKRLEAIAALVPQGARLADIGTDHAYLPVCLLERGRITQAIAADIAAGPCAAARATVAMHRLEDRVSVRQGSGLQVLAPGEADCITIAGMGGATIISILEASPQLAAAGLLLLQPMAGAPGLRRWLLQNGWEICDEELVDDAPHFYEIIAARRGTGADYSEAELCIGPIIIRKRHALLGMQLARQLAAQQQLVRNMERSERAMASAKYLEAKRLVQALEVLQHEYSGNS